MDAGRSAERAGQMRQGSLPSQNPQHTRHRPGEWTGARKPGPKSTHPSRSSEERRARTTMLTGGGSLLPTSSVAPGFGFRALVIRV